MREAATLLRADVQAGKKLVVVNQFVLKLPDVNSHKFHVTEGEVDLSPSYNHHIMLLKNLIC